MYFSNGGAFPATAAIVSSLFPQRIPGTRVLPMWTMTGLAAEINKLS